MMIVLFTRTPCDGYLHYAADTKYGCVAEMDVLRKPLGYEAHCTFVSGEEIAVHFNPLDATFGNTLADRLSFKLLEDGFEIGSFALLHKRTGTVFGWYPYYSLKTGTREYTSYEVGFETEGLYLCVYDEDNLVAIADRELKSVNHCQNYHVFIDDDTLLTPVLLSTLLYDHLASKSGERYSRNNIRHMTKRTTHQALLERFDASFIPMVIDKENEKERVTYGNNDT